MKTFLVALLLSAAIGAVLFWGDCMFSSPENEKNILSREPAREEKSLWKKLQFWEDKQIYTPTPSIASTPTTAPTPRPTLPETPTPTPTRTQTATPFPTPTMEPEVWTVRCYNNTSLEGSPSFIRKEKGEINYNWGKKSPDPAVRANDFSCSWRGIFFFAAGTYQFALTSDDGSRLWVDDSLMIDAWFPQRVATTRRVEAALPEGMHRITVKFFNQSLQAIIRLTWAQPKLFVPTPAPPSASLSPATPAPVVATIPPVVPTPQPIQLRPATWEKPPALLMTLAISQGIRELQFRIWYGRDALPAPAPAGARMIPPQNPEDPYVYYFPILEAGRWLQEAGVDVSEFPGGVIPRNGVWSITPRMAPFQGTWSWPPPNDAKEPYPLFVFRVINVDGGIQIERSSRPGHAFQCPAEGSYFPSSHISLPATCVVANETTALNLLKTWNPFLKDLPTSIWWGIYDQIP